MIALSGCIGKTYNLILVERLTTYLTVNKFVDPALQKAFLPGINGTIEHNIVMEELIKDAKAKNHTLHSTFFDLEDAFGRVPHGLIEDALTRHFLPQNIITYFHNSYTNSKAVVQTKEWRSSPFPFKRGVFQGDHISPIIFLMTFNPIIQSLQNQSQKFGYKLGDFSYVTLPYADDFCLISTHKTSHRNLINQIQSQVSSMGLKLKTSNVVHFLFQGGSLKMSLSILRITESPLSKVKSKNFWESCCSSKRNLKRLLPCLKTSFLKALRILRKLRSKISTNFGSTLTIFSPQTSLLTVHTLTQTQLKLLDTLTDKAIKRWAGVP